MTIAEIVGTLLFGFPNDGSAAPCAILSLPCRSGFVLTLAISAVSVMVGAALGLVFALCRTRTIRSPRERRHGGPVPDAVAAGLVEGVRGLPIVVLVLLTFHLPFPLFGLRVSEALLAVSALSIYAGVYLSEVFRSGLRAIDPEVREAARVLGLTRPQILRRIELPLMFRMMMPDMINIAVTVFKDSSTLSIVAFPELTYVGRQIFTSEPNRYPVILGVTLALYWFPAFLMSAVAARLEQRRARQHALP